MQAEKVVLADATSDYVATSFSPTAAVAVTDVDAAAAAAAAATTTTAESASADVPIELWDTKAQLVNPTTDIVLVTYPGLSGARFWARKCVESEAGRHNIS